MRNLTARALMAGGWLALCAAGLTAATAANAANCRDLTPLRQTSVSGPERPITPEDLARLRDIGMPGYSVPDQTPFTISPDDRMVAFTLRRGEPATNSYCLGLYVTDIASGKTRQIDAGGEYISYVISDLRGLVTPSGIPAINTPQWGPDGLWIAYLKRSSGVTQIWRVRVDGSGAEQVTHGAVDVDAVVWSSDGRRLLFSNRPALAAARAAIDHEGLTGYREDGRVMPLAGPKPFPRAPIPYEYWSIDIATGAVRPASADERLRITHGDDRPRPAHAKFFAQAGARRAWIVPRYPAHFQSPNELWIQDGTSEPIKCDAAACSDRISGVWVSADRKDILYFRREGWGQSETTLYRWHPGHAPQAVFTTEDVLTNCQYASGALICARESSLAPIRLVAIDPHDGTSRVVFDPNPEFDRIQLGSVQRLHWLNRYGTEGFGDLVLPPDHRPGQRHPLIITQYVTRGFLRGAISDEYPIQVFANRGFAVLSLDRPGRWAQARAKPDDPRTWEEFERENNRDWIDRRNVLSNLLAGLRKVEAMGVVDPKRIGITGTSEGSMALWFALNNTRNIFAAASMGSCCMDPKTLMAFGGKAWANELQASGYPHYTQKNPSFWHPFSLAMNVDKVRIPMLIQIPDDEYGLALETVTTYRDNHRPIEFYVFPQEHHNIWQPAHRLAMYEHNLDFFEKWLAPSGG